MDELVRLLAAALIGSAIIAGMYGTRALLRRRLHANRDQSAADLADLYGLPSDRASVLYLWGDRCVQCVALQEPALKKLSAAEPVEVRKLKAVSEPDLTRRFGILSVPATVVIGADHLVRAVNVGFADEATLRSQLVS